MKATDLHRHMHESRRRPMATPSEPERHRLAVDVGERIAEVLAVLVIIGIGYALLWVSA